MQPANCSFCGRSSFRHTELCIHHETNHNEDDNPIEEQLTIRNPLQELLDRVEEEGPVMLVY